MQFKIDHMNQKNVYFILYFYLKNNTEQRNQYLNCCIKEQTTKVIMEVPYWFHRLFWKVTFLIVQVYPGYKK